MCLHQKHFEKILLLQLGKRQPQSSPIITPSATRGGLTSGASLDSDASLDDDAVLRDRLIIGYKLQGEGLRLLTEVFGGDITSKNEEMMTLINSKTLCRTISI